MRKKEQKSVGLKTKLIISLLAVVLVGLIGFSLVPIGSEFGQMLQNYTKSSLLFVGKCVGWSAYLGATFLAQAVYEDAEIIKGKVFGLFIQVVAIVGMLSPYAFINALESEVLAHLAALVILCLMVWPVCFWQHKAIASIPKLGSTRPNLNR